MPLFSTTQNPERVRHTLLLSPTWHILPASLFALVLLFLPTHANAQPPITPTLFLPNIAAVAEGEPPATSPGETLSPQERLDIALAVESRVNELLPPIGTPIEERDFLAEVDLLGDELLTIPGVIATLVTTETLTVQAVMADSTSIAIVNNRPVDTPPSVQTAQVEAVQWGTPHLVQHPAQSFTPQGVVGKGRAVVTNFDGGEAVAAEIRQLLTNAGYEVLNLDASLSDMQNYKDLGVLYLDTHGVSYVQVSVNVAPDGSRSLTFGDSTYGLQTSTEINVSNLRQHENSINSGELILSIGESANGRTVKFAITEKFIAKHWSFDQGVIVLHACFGGADLFKPGVDCRGGCFVGGEVGVLDPSVLRQAMLAQGASAVVSFDNYTNTHYARPSMLFLLDRLLGSNAVETMSNPPLRPFPLNEVREEMGQQNLLSFKKPRITLGDIGLGGNDVNLTFDTTDSVAMLAPSVERVTVRDDQLSSEGELRIQGTFPATEGSVTIDNLAATIQSWNETEIVVNTPFNGHGAAGDLIVKGPDNVESNPVPMTLWMGTFKYTMDPAQGTLQVTANLDLHFRADIHKSRATLNDTPSVASQDVYLHVADSSHVQASGVYIEDNGNSIMLSGGGSLLKASNRTIDMLAGLAASAMLPQAVIQDGGLNGGVITLDLANKLALLCLSLYGNYEFTAMNTENESFTNTLSIALSRMPGLEDDSRGSLSCYQLAMRDDYTIVAGSRTFADSNSQVQFRIEWSDFAPVAPPTETTPG